MSPETKPRILIIEDESKVAETLQHGLEEEGYLVTHSKTGEEGLVCLLEQEFSAMILDLNLPGRDGLEILKTLRQYYPDLPVLILSARDSIEDRVIGLDRGADDYLVKPFAFPELMARLRVLLRREQKVSNFQYSVADLSVDIVSREVFRGSRAIALTTKEFEILELLLRNIGQPVSRQTIARDIWNVNRATPLDNVIDVHINRLRKKIDNNGEQRLIHTIRGLGYVLSDRQIGE